jgi:hypothetical protein
VDHWLIEKAEWIVYGLRVVAGGTQPQQAMQRKLVLLKKSFKQLEQ